MKTIVYNKKKIGSALRLILLVLFGLMMSQCQEDPMELPKLASDMVMTDYVYDNPEFSEFGNVIKYTGVENILRVRGPYTLFLPTNEAMKAFYDKYNKASYLDFEVDFLKEMANNHILKGPVSAGTMAPGALPYQNALNNDVASDLRGVDILINKQAIILKRDIKVSNGYIHHIDYVMDVLTKSVYDVLSDDGGYTIFKAGLDECGFSDTLDLISIPYGNIQAKVYYTILAVPDTLYQREGINNIADLVAKYDTDGDHKSDTNGFFQYIENHLLAGTNYFTKFNSKKTIYYLVTQNSYLQIIDEDRVYKINKGTDDTFTEFYYEQSNVPAKNGCIHAVNSQLPVSNTKPVEVLFEVTDHFDMQQGEYYHKYYARFYDGENDFKGIKWDADYLLYYHKKEIFLNDDGLNVISTGYFWIEITTPKIRKGAYNLSSNHFGPGEGGLNCYIDGEFYGLIGGAYNAETTIGPIIFTETKEHKIRYESAVSTGLWWDWIKFKPI